MFARKLRLCSFVAQTLGRQAARPPVNYLYTPAALGVTGFEQGRERIKQQFQTLREKFVLKMTEFTESPTGTIFTEDLKHMVHLAELSELGLVRNMIVKYAKQNKDLRFGSYVFGPVIMRMYHHLNAPDEALDAFNDPVLDGFFDQLVTYQILMDLLFVNGKYDDVISVFEKVKSKQLQGAKYPKNCVVLVFAALYKKNTAEAQEYCKNLWANLNAVGHYPMRRAATFAAALTIAQGEPAVAVEILSSVTKQSYVTVRNLKVSALADLGRADDALPILRNTLEFRDRAEARGEHTFAKETMDKMEAAVQKMNIKELTDEFTAIRDKLKGLNLVVDEPVDKQLCQDIEAYSTSEKNFRSTFKQRGYPRFDGRPSRPGVMSIV